MKSPILDLVTIAVRHLDDVPNVGRRAQLLDAAAEAVGSDRNAVGHARQLRLTAAELRRAEDAQLALHEILDNPATR